MGSHTSKAISVIKIVVDSLQQLSDEIAHEQVEAVAETPVVPNEDDDADEVIMRCFKTISQYGKRHTENTFFKAFGYTFAGPDSRPRNLDAAASHSVEALQDVIVYTAGTDSLGEYLTETLGKDSTLSDSDIQNFLAPMIGEFYQKRNTDWQQYHTQFQWIHKNLSNYEIPKQLDFNCEYANCVEGDQVVLVMVFSAVWYTFVDE